MLFKRLVNDSYVFLDNEGLNMLFKWLVNHSYVSISLNNEGLNMFLVKFEFFVLVAQKKFIYFWSQILFSH